MARVYIEIEKAEPRFLDLASAAIYLGISRSAVRELVGDGQLESVHLPSGNHPQVRLDQFLLDKANLRRAICFQRGEL